MGKICEMEKIVEWFSAFRALLPTDLHQHHGHWLESLKHEHWCHSHDNQAIQQHHHWCTQSCASRKVINWACADRFVFYPVIHHLITLGNGPSWKGTTGNVYNPLAESGPPLRMTSAPDWQFSASKQMMMENVNKQWWKNVIAPISEIWQVKNNAYLEKTQTECTVASAAYDKDLCLGGFKVMVHFLGIIVLFVIVFNALSSISKYLLFENSINELMQLMQLIHFWCHWSIGARLTRWLLLKYYVTYSIEGVCIVNFLQ